MLENEPDEQPILPYARATLKRDSPRIAEESELVWRFFGCRHEGVFVEIGANHPTKRSQTWFLETQGWTGVLVEPDPRFCELLRAQRPRSRVFQLAVGAPKDVGEIEFLVGGSGGHSAIKSKKPRRKDGELIRVKLRTLDDILAEAGISRIDFLSIDVEGMELEVLDGLDFSRHRPQLISLEDFCVNFKKKTYLRGRGYKLVRRVSYNNWYVPRESAASLFSVGSTYEVVRLLRKDFLSVPFIKVQRLFRRFK